MIRLTHKLLLNEGQQFALQELENIRNATVVTADNVAAYINSVDIAGQKELRSLFPNIRLPLKGMLIEWSDTKSFSSLAQLGLLLLPPESEASRGFLKENATVREKAQEATSVGGDYWYFRAFSFFKGSTSSAIEGLVTHDAMGEMEWFGALVEKELAEQGCGTADVLALYLPAFAAISFMHCKNVAIKESPGDAPPPKWLRRQKAPAVKYHVLDIEPMKQVLRTEGRIEETGLKKALHICRGHFATYTEEKPLFGKIAGTFWVPQCIKGDHKYGTVVKDYNLVT